MERTDSSYVIFSVIIGGVLVLGAVVLGNQSHLLTKAPQVVEQNIRTWTAPDRQVLRERTLLSVDGTTRTQDWFLDLIEVVPNTFNLTATTNRSRATTDGTINENRFTRRFAQEILTNQAAAATGSGTVRSEDEILLAFARELVPKNYTLRDINVINSTPERNATYLNNAGDIIRKSGILQISISEQQLFDRAVRRNNPEDFKTLKELSNTYRNIRDELLKVQVPTRQAEKHLLLINGAHRMATALHFMSEYQKDSFLATLYNESINDHIAHLNTTYIMYGEEVYRNRERIDAFAGGSIFLGIYNGLMDNNN